MDPAYKPRYKRLRNQLALVLAGAWIIAWYVHLDRQYDAAMALLPKCDGLAIFQLAKCKAGQWSDSASASSDFSTGMILVVLTAPFAFLISRYIARVIVERQEAADVRREAVAITAQKREEEEQRARRIAQSEDTARAIRHSINRGEFIHKLGSVSDLLDLLPATTDADRSAIIRQSINNELRDLVAKHTLPELIDLVRSDETIRLSVSDLIDRCEAVGPRISAAEILRTALARSAVAV